MLDPQLISQVISQKAYHDHLYLAYQLKVQRGAFFGAPPKSLAEPKREPGLMKLSMILLAAGCVALSFAVITGFADPWLVGDAQEVLSGGTFGGRP